jgi:beta-galactosidase/beta-glucuronidase
MPRPEYPRPQLRRRDWTNLNGEWSFAFDDSDAGLADGWQNTNVSSLRSKSAPFNRRITVPFCYQSKLSGIGETAFHDVVWYARVFEYAPAGDERLSQLDRSWSIEFAEQGVRSYQRFS